MGQPHIAQVIETAMIGHYRDVIGLCNEAPGGENPPPPGCETYTYIVLGNAAFFQPGDAHMRLRLADPRVIPVHFVARPPVSVSSSASDVMSISDADGHSSVLEDDLLDDAAAKPADDLSDFASTLIVDRSDVASTVVDDLSDVASTGPGDLSDVASTVVVED